MAPEPATEPAIAPEPAANTKPARQCAGCSGPVSAASRTGHCRRCVSAFNARNPEHIARQRAGQQRKMLEDPLYLEQLRRSAARIGRSPAAAAARRERWMRERMWEKGAAASQAPEAMARRAKAISDQRMAWCPLELRAAYMELVTRKRLKAAEARAMILDQHEADMQRWRRANGLVEQPGPVGAPVIGVARGPKLVFPADAGFVERCIATLAALAGVPESELRTGGINRKLSRHRQAACWALKLHYGDAISYPAIGRALGVDHASAIWAHRRAEVRRHKDPVLAALIDAAVAA